MWLLFHVLNLVSDLSLLQYLSLGHGHNLELGLDVHLILVLDLVLGHNLLIDVGLER